MLLLHCTIILSVIRQLGEVMFAALEVVAKLLSNSKNDVIPYRLL